ncbi:hypothetical protein VNO78_31450 [Psophocarpus tetragonolobus]|uniref:Peptidase A1 domain-containing protein n=1 Tax=Psophocarpus tetragonolobus TaxID=3891 RepID=A0AAN9RZ87_PSOTE
MGVSGSVSVISLSMLVLLSSWTSSIPDSESVSMALPLTLTSTGKGLNRNPKQLRRLSSWDDSLKWWFKYSMALVVSLPIGTPPQHQQMVLDTGSQLSWIQCHNKSTSFDPSLSSSFYIIPCTHPLCKPRVPDFTLPTTCDQNRLCHYSYFFADGTLAEGNLVREKLSFSHSQTTPPLTLGCATESSDARGILGMNLGRLSFPSQAKITKFSYCVPTPPTPTGSFYLGNNPYSPSFRYVNMLTFSQTQSQRMPNLDPLAYTLPMQAIRISGKTLNIEPSVFLPNAGGSGQTMLDSGSQFTFLVDAAYDVLRQEVTRLVGPRLKKGYVYGGIADMCFDAYISLEIQRLIGPLVFQFDKGVDIVVPKERVFADVGGRVHCLAIGRSERLGAASNIIGNIHQQNLWVEFDISNRRIGFREADCSRLPNST